MTMLGFEVMSNKIGACFNPGCILLKNDDVKWWNLARWAARSVGLDRECSSAKVRKLFVPEGHHRIRPDSAAGGEPTRQNCR